jgi:cytochrome b
MLSLRLLLHLMVFEKMKKNNNNEKLIIWDFPLRIFHIILIFLVVGSIVTAKANLLFIHEYFGLSILGLICFRIIWGFIGTYYSRFESFNMSIKEALIQFSKNYNSTSIRTALGSYSTLVFLMALLALTVSGLFSSDDILYDGPLTFLMPKYINFWTLIHNIFHYFLYFLTTLHLLAICYYQFFRKNLIIQRIFYGYSKTIDINLVLIKDKSMKGILLLFICVLLPYFIFEFII